MAFLGQARLRFPLLASNLMTCHVDVATDALASFAALLVPGILCQPPCPQTGAHQYLSLCDEGLPGD